MSQRAVTVEEHLQRILDTVEPLPAYEQPVLDVLGLPVAEDVVAPLSLPVFDNSAMDGYAVFFHDVADADERPVHLPVVGEVAAGSDPGRLEPGTAVRIMTGARMPEGADTVVQFEWTDWGEDEVRIKRAPQPAMHVRAAGTDVHAGDVVLRAGEVVGPRQAGLLASLGIARVQAPPRPRVVLLSTGAELQEAGKPLGPDQIYDSNSVLLAAAARAHGAIAYRAPISSDDPERFAEALGDQLHRADVVITSGGVSKGTRDVVKEVLAKLDTMWFGEVAMQPGKPQGFGLVGSDRIPLFALPGNPVSSYVSFEVFVAPGLRRLMGRDAIHRELVTAALTTDVSSPAGRRQFLRARYDYDADGATATLVGGPGSHLVGGLAASDCLVIVPEDVEHLDAGAEVEVLLLDGDM